MDNASRFQHVRNELGVMPYAVRKGRISFNCFFCAGEPVGVPSYTICLEDGAGCGFSTGIVGSFGKGRSQSKKRGPDRLTLIIIFHWPSRDYDGRMRLGS